MKKTFLAIVALILALNQPASSQVTIDINTLAPKKYISPYIYGKNNSLSDKVFGGDPLTAQEWQYLRDLGIKMFRENGGNNASKYNWRRKLSSHPDWYNNVYAHDWNFAASSLGINIPSAQGMWAFQLMGKAAKTNAFNFNDWAYNGSNWWSGCRQNLAGGGVINEAGGENATTNGNPDLYLENWNADSTTGILTHWFGSGGIGLDTNKIQYWSMDNEPEIWNGTHDDVYPDAPSAEEFIQLYLAVAKKARALYPGIKLVGPVPANEWQWYNWDGGSIRYNGHDYVWLEYFILRIAEEQQATGIRLLDVLDIHFYPEVTDPFGVTQLHRVFFDTTYDYPGANGVRRTGSGGWDNSITKEYIFKRCNDWLNEYIGPNHGVTFSVTETSLPESVRANANLNANWYASMIREFSKQGVEIFTPWDWAKGMSEVVHLFTHYGHEYYIPAVSSNELYVSAYPTMNQAGDSMTIFLVNRDIATARNIELNLGNFNIYNGSYPLYTLSNLPSSETFVSHTSNALQEGSVNIENNNISMLLPPLSVSALVVGRNNMVYNQFGEQVAAAEAESGVLNGVSVASATPDYSGTGYVTSFNAPTDRVTLNLTVATKDVYRIVIRYAGGAVHQNITVNNYNALIDFVDTSNFTYFDAGGFLLNAGSNTITLKQADGDISIDRIELYRMDENAYRIDKNLIDPEATEETKELYNFLQYQFGERIISGQTFTDYTDVKNQTGKSPMLNAGDFQHYTQGYAYWWVNGGHTFGYDVNDNTINSLINWYNNANGKGIISMHWHWHSPSAGLSSDPGTNTFYTDETTFDITQAVIPGTDEYDFVIRDIDSIAFQLKKFQTAGIPILWRPLHEAGGGWFWWGAKGAAPCLALWDLLRDRLINYHNLHNLIWVWSTPEPDWYPGNDKVDIIGFDSYPGAYNYTIQKDIFDNLYTITRGEKLIAMSENGPIPNVDASLAGDAPWLYFMSWTDLVFEQNSNQHLQEVYNNPVVLTLESTNAKTGFEWRSSLYPEDWKPGYKDGAGRFLHDFSYAGYHKGESPIPAVDNNILDITQPPYNADNSGAIDVTDILQQALDDAGEAGGGVVYLPPGKYRINASDTSFALHIRHDSTILRGAGPDQTFLLNTETNMRYKDIIKISGNGAGWFSPQGTPASIKFNLLEPTRTIPVESVNGFSARDLIILASKPTEEFIEEHKMTGYWTASDIKGVAFLRRIDSVDAINNLIIIDAPTRYALKTRDQARIYKVTWHISECGIENLSIGNVENTNTGWDEETYSILGTGAYEVHGSHAIQLKNAENCWVRNVRTYKPETNTNDFHVLSNALKLNQCRFITIDSCVFEKSQYEGGGGNGYMYTIESNDCLIKNSKANDGRHNYDFKYPYSNGNVILRSRGENSKYASDFHMFLSMSNLFDDCTFNRDFLESVFRPYGGSSLHGYTSTQSVFYNTTGEAYHPGNNVLVDSRQYGWGYIIGTSGAASDVNIDPSEGSLNGYLYNTSPRDFTEGIGEGEFLVPASLYLDQLERRMNNSTGNTGRFKVNIIIRDSESNNPLPGSIVQIYSESILTDENGVASFSGIPEFFVVNAAKEFHDSLINQVFMIYSDTTLNLLLTQQRYNVTIQLLRSGTLVPISMNTVVFGGVSQVTNSGGNAFFNAKAGSADYSVSKTSYQTETGTITVESDTVIVLILTQISANLRIRLRKGTTPVNNAEVTINEVTVVSNSLGDAVFNQLTIPFSYTYDTRKTGYEDRSGTVFLQKDTIVEVQMTSVTVSNTKDIEARFHCWPNPAVDILNVRLPETCVGGTMVITDIRGVEIYRNTIAHDEPVIELHQYLAGTYILKIICDKESAVHYFVKK
jgi:hypothetical protein